MKALFKICVPLLAVTLLAGCGGGGSDGGIFAPPPADAITITLQADTQNLPLNPNIVLPYPGGPFTTEVTATLRHKNDGSLVTNIDLVNVSISPTSVATFSTLDDPETDDVNEVQLRIGQGPVNVVAGKATIFVTSAAASGTATLTVNAPESNGLKVESASMEFTVANAGAPLPSDITLSADPTAVYLPGAGGGSTSLLTAFVTDSSHQPVPDPSAGNGAHNNVLFEVLGGADHGSVSGISASGSSVSGQSIKVRTTKGIANATFHAGTAQGPITVKVTADAADNNVDNGIDTPVVSTISLTVSDGKLYSLEITSPAFAPRLPGITVNKLAVSADAAPASGSTSLIPPNPDASLSLVVSVLATDRQGNPVLPGTAIHFGSVDEPVAPYDQAGGGNYFELSGLDGNPKESGNLFTALSGHFTTAGGGAGPGDALIVFGKAVQGNADLESAVTVAAINSATSIRVTPDFNPNDTTGTSVDYGAVLPYLIGRSRHGNVTAAATTNDVGVASAKLTYTVNTVGHAVAVWAQGNGVDRQVTDAVTMTYPGVAPAALYAFPSPIPGNTTTHVTACLSGALGIPVRGYPIGFAFQLDQGSGSVDGTAGAGTFAHFTGANGCAKGEVKTSGLGQSSAGGSSGTLILSAAGATATVDILVNVDFLSVSSNGYCSSDGDDEADPPVDPSPLSITVTAMSGGSPLSNVGITASCTNGVTITPTSGTTSSAGTITFAAIAPDHTEGQCTFTSNNGTTAITIVQGSGKDFSPACP